MRKTVLFVLTGLVVLATLLASCGKSPTTTTTQTPTGTPTSTPPSTTPSPTGTQKPQYGGTMIVVSPADILQFDDGINAVFFTASTHLTNDELLTGDWTKGPAGSGDFTWLSNGIYSWSSKTSSVAEKWTLVEPGHITFQIRQGIRWGLNTDSAASKLVAGRDLTADDVVYSLNRLLTAPSYWVGSAGVWAKSAKVTKVDATTVDVTCEPSQSYNFATYLVDFGSIVPHEVIEKYGNMSDWHNSVGSGPFFLTDFVSNSQATFKKNPNYWRTDPIGAGKGQQLPYVDGIKMLIITDTSTLLSAMRTAKVDLVQSLTYDDAQGLKDVKNLQELSFVPAFVNQINMHTDKPDLPFSKLEVRQALMKATNFNSIVNDLMGGQASAVSWPITPMPDFKNAYLSLSDAPAAVQDLYKYDVTKAKQMLSDAGYPNGFTTHIYYSTVPTSSADYLSVVKQMWSMVNVDLVLQPIEFALSQNRWALRNYDEMYYGQMASSGTYWRAANLTGTGPGWNLSFVNDAQVNAARDQMVNAFILGDDATVDQTHKALMPYVLQQAWVIPTPVQNLDTFWWPWLKGYHGELSPGVINEWQWTMYTWIDQTLKKTMGH